jgi:hypothetical protein
LRQLANDYDNQLQNQIRLAKQLASISPYAVLVDVATTLADTNGESQIAFLRMARQYEDDYFEQEYKRGLETGRGIHRFDPVRDPLLFRPTAPNLRMRLRQSLPNIGLLAFFAIVYFMSGYLMFLRRPV